MLGTEPNIAALMGKFLLLGIVIAHRWNSQYKCWHDPIESYAAYAMRHALSTSNHHSDRLRELDHDGSVQGLQELEQMFHWAYIREDLLGTLGFTMVFWAIKYMDSKAFLQILPTNLGDPAKFCRELVESGRALHYQVWIMDWYTVQKNLLENGDTPWRLFNLCTFTVLKCQIWVCPVCLLWAIPKTPWSMPRPLLSIFVRHYIIKYPRQGRFPLKSEQSAWW